jgi:hypothetical protein
MLSDNRLERPGLAAASARDEFLDCVIDRHTDLPDLLDDAQTAHGAKALGRVAHF